MESYLSTSTQTGQTSTPFLPRIALQRTIITKQEPHLIFVKVLNFVKL